MRRLCCHAGKGSPYPRPHAAATRARGTLGRGTLGLLVLLVTILGLGGASAQGVALVHATVQETTNVFQARFGTSFGVPLARGTVTDVADLRVWREDDGTALPCQARMLVRWPDGSVRHALIDTALELAAREEVRLAVGLDQTLPPGVDPFSVAGGEVIDASDGRRWQVYRPASDGEGQASRVLGLHARLTDRFGFTYSAVVDPDSIEVLETGPVRLCLKLRGKHLRDTDEGLSIPFHTFTALLHIQAGQPLAHVEWTLENTPLDEPPGALAFKSYELLGDFPRGERGLDLPAGWFESGQRFTSTQVKRAAGPWRVDGEKINAPRTPTDDLWAGVITAGGGTAVGSTYVRLVESAENWPTRLALDTDGTLRLGFLPAMENREYWLDDATRKTFRFDLAPDTGRAGRELMLVELRRQHPTLDPAEIAASGAWGDLGLFHVPDRGQTRGKVDLPQSEGGWIDWGEFRTKNTHSTGSPRNRLSVFLEWAQSGREDLFKLSRARAWHAMDQRPFHIEGFDADEFPRANLYEGTPHPNESPDRRLGRAEMEGRFKRYKDGLPGKGHGYNGFDPEHMTLDDVYELWCLTGSWLARDAMRSAGEAMLTWRWVMPFGFLHTGRTTGWTLRALVHCYRVTGDERYIDAAAQMVRRADEERGKGEIKYFHRNKPDNRHIADDESEAPWMVAVAMYGLCSYWSETADPLVPPMLADLTEFILSAYRGVGFIAAMPLSDPAFDGETWQPLGTNQWIPGALATAATVIDDHAAVDRVYPYYKQMLEHSSKPIRFGSDSWHWWQPYLVSLQDRHGPAAVNNPAAFLPRLRERPDAGHR